MNGQHTWSTGNKGDEETLSNLVCGIKDDPKCINTKHKKGHIYGDKDTWERRRKFIDSKSEELGDTRGRLTKVDVQSKVYKLFNELDREQGEKGLTYKYLHKVLDILEEYSL